MIGLTLGTVPGNMVCMNPKARGERSEAQIIAVAVERGYSVSIPFGNNQRYDLILDDGERLIRAQCKTAWLTGKTITFATTSKNGFTGGRRAYDGQADLFLVYSPDLKKVFKIPVEAAPACQMSLRFEQGEPKSPKSTINWSKDFEF